MAEIEKNDRRTKRFVVDSADRDNGKVFIITEKSAVAAEAWALRVFLAFARSGVEIPTEVKDIGLLGVAVLGMNAARFLAFAEAKTILDDLMTCVEIVPDPRNNEFKRALVENDVSEVATLMRLKREVLEVHLGFSLADADQLGGAVLAAVEALNQTSSNIQTSPQQ